MVRKIDKNTSTSQKKPLEQVRNRNFKNLSSGIAVKDKPAVESSVVNATGNKHVSKKLTETVKDLNDAVSFSFMALSSLEKVNSSIDPSVQPADVIKELTNDLDKIRSGIDDTLSLLKDRVSRAKIIQENLQSSTSRLEDLDGAKKQADLTGTSINNHIEQAINSHVGLSPERVAELLSED